MPWKVAAVSEVRGDFITSVLTLRKGVAEASREFGISRKTAYKWLRRYREDPNASLEDRSRRPERSPNRTSEAVEKQILKLRRCLKWGARKIHAYLRDRGVDVPDRRTVHRVLSRHGQVEKKPPEEATPGHFERARANELWQIDFKGPFEVARGWCHGFTVLDDHSRYLLEFRATRRRDMKTAWDVLWAVFGEYGLPDSVLSDNAFSARYREINTLSWFDSQLLRLGIQPLHGRPYHPQTQGKVERVQQTIEREFLRKCRRDSVDEFHGDFRRWRRLYNAVRPHEALGDQPPLTRWSPSSRTRPSKVPELSYPPGAVIRKVSTVGDIRWKKYRILAGRGLTGQYVRLEERDEELVVLFSEYKVRALPYSELRHGTML